MQVCVILLVKPLCKMLGITNMFLEEAQQIFSKKPDVNFVFFWRKDNINFGLSQLLYWINTSILSCWITKTFWGLFQGQALWLYYSSKVNVMLPQWSQGTDTGSCVILTAEGMGSVWYWVVTKNLGIFGSPLLLLLNFCLQILVLFFIT